MSRLKIDRLLLSGAVARLAVRLVGALVLMLYLPACTSNLADDFDLLRDWTEQVVRDRAQTNRMDREVFHAATVRDASAVLEARYIELAADLERSGIRRTEDCRAFVTLALKQRAEDELDDLKKRIALSEANRAVGDGNLRREHYYRLDLYTQLSVFAESQRDWIDVARGRVRAAVAEASCALAVTRRAEVDAYRKEMRLAKSAWKLGCGNQLGEYHRDLEASRDAMDAYRANLERRAGALPPPTSTEPPTLLVPPRTYKIERCFRNLVNEKSSHAAKRAAANIGQAADKALADIQAVRCVPANFPRVKHPNHLDLRPRAPCGRTAEGCPRPEPCDDAHD